MHIDDYCSAIECLINAPSDKIKDQIFNVGYQNLSIAEIANKVKKVVEGYFPDKGRRTPIFKVLLSFKLFFSWAIPLLFIVNNK